MRAGKPLIALIDKRPRLPTVKRKNDACSDTRPTHGRKLGSTASGSKPREPTLSAASVYGPSE